MIYNRRLAKEIKDIRNICSLLYTITKIPAFFYNKKDKLIIKCSSDLITEYIKSSGVIFEECRYNLNSGGCMPVIKMMDYMGNFIFIKVRREKTNIGTIIVGPSISSEIDNNFVASILSRAKFSIREKAEFSEYAHSVPVINYNDFVNLGRLIYYILYNKRISFEDIMGGNDQLFDKHCPNKEKINTVHYSLQYEKGLIKAVGDGDKKKLSEYIENSSFSDIGVCSKNPVRNQKNHFINLVNMVVHESAGRGFDWNFVFEIGEFYIQIAEDMNSIEDIVNLEIKMLYDFAERINMLKSYKYSLTIVKCQNYIISHLSEKITVPQIAESVGLNPGYISQLFKKETGISISEYIQNERVNKAKTLLSETDNSLSEICGSLGFYDQSHFSKVFKNSVGVTPKKYRCLNAV